ncbi:type II secretion system F family protein [Sulfitobacter geojensis]|uniref:Type II secretion system F family protein n=1 Tax=Sulfitobacter geojensis TaxID=1342299 RepID=A0AAE3B5M1_9RHOB|nr:type II secretion system F family protein [Sulfitobacter geojensis]MBM1688294.1 type II secretion system F family protein [Sulfitobacter geojensis]MBM1692361.1 type II secretion system F family protein [Sulfitobacter geojensis]MBM1704527.1 type II secretion system F family protein [Sulfitobacter geojensis]MBM1708585.1 type II secretion system F family protein [Sulfitobacter geojensis]MBM1712650.1 type II secretion system F family protein [Sulfitobacter geojensis]
MSETSIHIFWMAFLGLSSAMMALTLLMYSEHQRSQRAGRLNRANGSEKARRVGDIAVNTGPFGTVTGKMRNVVVKLGERLSVVLGGESRETAANLSSAGFRSRDALLIYAFLKTILPLTALLGGLIWLLITKPLDITIIMPAAMVIGAALGLSIGVDFVVNKARTARLARIRQSFPDMLELIVITSEAGLGPQPALHRVAQEMAVTHPDLAQEMLQMVSEMAMTSDARGAYEKLNVRAPLPEIAVFTQTLDQSDRYGTPFARAMRTLIDEQRSNRLVAVEEKAARLPVLMTMPLIFCIMPAVFVVLVGPAGLNVFDNILSGG